MSLLWEAAEKGNTREVERLLQAGADVHARGDAALRWAAAHGHTETVALLLQAGADVHAENDDALRRAALLGHTETVALLLRAGADVHADDDYALREAADDGYTETVALLLQAGADVHAGYDDALRWAARNGKTETVALLLNAGADVHAEADYALRWAAAYGRTETVALLLQHGADVHAENDDALRRAAKNSHTETVALLLKAGADVHAENDDALRKAGYNGQTETVALLLQHGADINVLPAAQRRKILAAFPPDPRLAFGPARKAIQRARELPERTDPREFRRLFPVEYERVAAVVAGRPITPAVVEELVQRFGLEWQVTQTVYGGQAQRFARRANDVLLLNVSLPALAPDEIELKHLQAVKEVSKLSGHPIADERDFFTIGWARYNTYPKKGVLFVEEIQSDVPIVRRGLRDPGFRQKMQKHGLSSEGIDRTLSLLEPFVRRFYTDALSLVFDVALKAGLEVEVPTWEVKAAQASREDYAAPPRSVYDETAKKMGMKQVGRSRVLDVGPVWHAVPNRARR
jgi:ankyrin repeat protein